MAFVVAVRRQHEAIDFGHVTPIERGRITSSSAYMTRASRASTSLARRWLQRSVRQSAPPPDARFATPPEALAALAAKLEAMRVARPAPTIPIAAPVKPNPPTQIPAEEIASIPVSRAFDDERVRLLSRPPPASFWHALLLVALILLLAESPSWMLAYLLFL
jgi:hypothetical protein